jgi:hypothetical protein
MHDNITKVLEIERRIRQGCPLAPNYLQFGKVLNYMMKDIQRLWEIKVITLLVQEEQQTLSQMTQNF